MSQPTPKARDGALCRLCWLTAGAAGTALGALTTFAPIAAATNPGRADSAAQTAGSTSGAAASNTTDPSSGLVTSTPPQTFTHSSSSGRRHAATGGS